MPLADAASQQPVVGVHAVLCRKLDVECTSPASEDVVSDATGRLTFSVPARFDGFALIQGERITPSLYFFAPLIDRSREMPSVPLASPLIVSLLVKQLTGELPAADHGVVLLTAADCQEQFASGVSFSSAATDALTIPFYSVGSLPDRHATATDATGYGGLVNVPPGAVTITGTLADQQRAVSTISLLVRPGYTSYSRVVPGGN